MAATFFVRFQTNTSGEAAALTARDSQAVGSSLAPRAAPAAAPHAAPEQPLANQIAESIRANGVALDRQITVSLHPPELGRVRIVLRTENDEIHGSVRVENREALARLEREAPAVVARLEEAGVQVRRLDVTLSPPPQGDAGQGGLLREGGQGPAFAWREPAPAPADDHAASGTRAEWPSDAEAVLARGGVDVRV